MAGNKEVNSNLEIKGKINLKDVPNNTPTGYLVWNSEIKDIAQRTSAQLLTDLNLITATNIASLYYNKTQVDTNIKTAVDDIQIGGRNLIKNSKVVPFYSADNRAFSEVKLFDDYFEIKGYAGMAWNRYTEFNLTERPSGLFTVSFDFMTADVAGNVSALFTIYPLGKSIEIPNTFGKWQRFSITADIGAFTGAVVFVFSKIVESVSVFRIKNFKLEKGNKPSDYSPNPLDQVTDWNTTDVNDFSFLKNKPTKLSQFTNDSGYLTSSALSAYAEISWVNANFINNTSSNVIDTTDWELRSSIFEGRKGRIPGDGYFKFIGDFPKMGWDRASISMTDEEILDIENCSIRQSGTTINSFSAGLYTASHVQAKEGFKTGDGVNNNVLLDGGGVKSINEFGKTYVAGDGISITGANNVITNTKPNIVQTLSGSGNTVNLSNGGSHTIPAQTWGSITGKPTTFPSDAHSHTFASITNKPTSIAGYGITDSYVKAQVDANIKTAVDDIQIGGRNLIVDSEQPTWFPNDIGLGVSVRMEDSTGKFTRTTPSAGKNVSVYGHFIEDFVSGQFSRSMYFRHFHTSNITIWGQSIAPDKWVQVKAEAYFNSNGYGGYSTSVPNVAIDTKKLKVEKGNKATDYSPNPLDQVSDWNTTDVNDFSFIKNKPTKFPPEDHTHPQYLSQETDPTVPTHVKSISTGNINNWNTAFGWGNHAGLYSPINHGHTFASITDKPATLAGYGITDSFKSLQTIENLDIVSESGIYRQEEPSSGYSYTTTLNLNSLDGRQQLTIERTGGGMKFRGSSSSSSGSDWSPWRTVWDSNNLPQTSIENWNTAFGWGNHATAGYLTSSALSPYAQTSWVNANFDKYNYWNLQTNNVQRTSMPSGSNLNLVAGANVTINYSAGGTVTINAANSGVPTNMVTTDTTQTITGIKTFTQSITAPAFYEGSLKSLKKNIKTFEKSGLDLVGDLNIVTFDRKDESAKNKIGIIADDSPKEFLSEELDAVDLYKTVFIQAKAIQELSEEINNLRELLIEKLK